MKRFLVSLLIFALAPLVGAGVAVLVIWLGIR
jgi:hypothetical protein